MAINKFYSINRGTNKDWAELSSVYLQLVGTFKSPYMHLTKVPWRMSENSNRGEISWLHGGTKGKHSFKRNRHRGRDPIGSLQTKTREIENDSLSHWSHIHLHLAEKTEMFWCDISAGLCDNQSGTLNGPLPLWMWGNFLDLGLLWWFICNKAHAGWPDTWTAGPGGTEEPTALLLFAAHRMAECKQLWMSMFFAGWRCILFADLW